VLAPDQASAQAALELSGGEAIARMLQAHGAGPIFGMGGFQLLPFYDATRRLSLSHHLINDERAGVFAADAYAKVSGRVGIVDATLGPGAINLVTGLVEALNAGSPIVAIVGDTHRDHSGKNMTQEGRQLEILRPACKELLRVESPARVPELVRRAFAVATSGRPGPVVIDVPEDVSHASCVYDAADFHAPARNQAIPAVRCRPDAQDVAVAARALAVAHRPVVLAGGGVHLSGAAATLTAFARAQGIPVAHTLTGKGAIPCIDPLSVGLFGRYDRIANGLIEEADVLLVVGCKLGEIATKRYTVPAPGKTVIHVDLLPEEFGRTYEPTHVLWGDAQATLEELSAALADEGEGGAAARAEYVHLCNERMQQWRRGVSAKLTSAESPVSMARLLHELNALLPEDALLIADGGFAAHWGGLLYDTKRAGRGFVADRGFASIGYGVPGAIGAALAGGSRPVVSLTGDGGMNMMLGELETARRLNLDFVAIVVNNAASGYVKALQHLVYGPGAYQASDLSETNYAEVARALGCHGARVEDPAELSDAIRTALATRGPSIVDVAVTRDPALMLPGVDSRAAKYRKGDRIA
jgi:acetolactate synthase-1/2/3 large subunit